MGKIEIEVNEYFKTHFSIEDISNSKINLSNGIQKLIEEGIVEKDGCYFLYSKKPEGKLSPDLNDKTGNEAFYNKILIDDYSDEIENIEHCYFFEGIAFAKKMAHCFLKEKFYFYVLYDNNFCTFTFHKQREGEYWLVEDLDKYKEDAIVLIKTLQ
ncbi:hypothetical protein BA6E_102173 [Bacteroidales bacterium 6E]|nr:hypothetical protein BA6E_102173 [Bacteroidales bacterium 6E]